MRDLKAGVVGCGFVSGAYHLPAQQAAAGITTVALTDVDLALARRQAETYGVEATYSDYEEMLRDQSLDFVVVCVPPELHLPVTQAAASRGVHVLCEKPLAATPEEVSALVSCVQESGIRFMVSENFWWHPDVLDAKRRIDEGIIGDIFHIRVEEFINDVDPTYRRQRERFLMFEQDVHYVDVIRHYVGRPVERVHAVTRRIATQDLVGENFASILLEFEGGVVARIDECWCAARGDQFVMRMRLDGTHGSLFINAQDSPFKIYTDKYPAAGWVYPPTSTKPPVGHASGYAAPWPVDELRAGVIGVYDAFGKYVRDGIAPVTVVEDNAQTMQVIFAAYESAASGEVICIKADDNGRPAA
jgi:predicted dehydrogenase